MLCRKKQLTTFFMNPSLKSRSQLFLFQLVDCRCDIKSESSEHHDERAMRGKRQQQSRVGRILIHTCTYYKAQVGRSLVQDVGEQRGLSAASLHLIRGFKSSLHQTGSQVLYVQFNFPDSLW